MSPKHMNGSSHALCSHGEYLGLLLWEVSGELTFQLLGFQSSTSRLRAQLPLGLGLAKIFRGPQRALTLVSHFPSINRAVRLAQKPVKFASPLSQVLPH